MKKSVLIIALTLLCVIFVVSFVNAATCSLSASLINQDPYPAIPGDYVKIAFQLNGIENPSCGTVDFQIHPEFPFSLDPGQNDSITVQSGTASHDYSSALIIPFKLRVDKTAVAGNNTIKVTYTPNAKISGSASITTDFNIEVGNTKSDFDVVMQDITPQGTSFIVTNTGENSAESVILTVQSNDVSISGPKSVVLGRLDNGDFTIAHVRVVPNSGVTELSVKISYTDNSGKRIDVNKVVPIESSSRVEKICWNNSEKWYLKWIFAIVGLFVGIEAAILLRSNKNKKKD